MPNWTPSLHLGAVGWSRHALELVGRRALRRHGHRAGVVAVGAVRTSARAFAVVRTGTSSGLGTVTNLHERDHDGLAVGMQRPLLPGPHSRLLPAVAGRGEGAAGGPSHRDPKGPCHNQDSRTISGEKADAPRASSAPLVHRSAHQGQLQHGMANGITAGQMSFPSMANICKSPWKRCTRSATGGPDRASEVVFSSATSRPVRTWSAAVRRTSSTAARVRSSEARRCGAALRRRLRRDRVGDRATLSVGGVGRHRPVTMAPAGRVAAPTPGRRRGRVAAGGTFLVASHSPH